MSTPAVSIILPTYNRATFLPEAIASIRGQQFTDWELIVVDDGSTDETSELLPKLVDDLPQPYRYIFQENQGAYAARNTGLDHAQGKYIAFYDSDDLWLPHHLQDCVTALEDNPDVDWVYGASRIVDFDTGRVLHESTFYEHNKPRHFRTLPYDLRGSLHVLHTTNLLDALLTWAGLYAGLQNSVIRSDVFISRRFADTFNNEAEDQLMVLRAVAAGMRFAYFTGIHHIYRIHHANSTGTAVNRDHARRIAHITGMIRGFEHLQLQLQRAIPRKSQILLRRRIATIYFWDLGYATHWCAGSRVDALQAYRHALTLYPFSFHFWKTFILALTRSPPIPVTK